MNICGLFSIFKKHNKINSLTELLHIHDNSDIILKELDDKIKIAESNYKDNMNSDNLLKCIKAVDMRDNYIKNSINTYVSYK